MPQVQTKLQADYSSGLNDTASPFEIGDTEASVLHDWDITNAGKLTRRDGLTLVGNAFASNPITGMGSFIRNGATPDALVTETTNLWYLNSATWTKIENNLTNTAGLKFWFENIQIVSKIYFGNEDNVLSSWDRAGTTMNTCITQLASTVPHGNVYRWFKNFLFTMNNVNVSGTKYPNRLYWSNIGDPTTWDTTSNWFEIPGDGRAITMVPMQDKLVLFKERSIQILTGYGNSSWQVTSSNTAVNNFSGQIGTYSVFGACQVGNDVWFIDTEGNVRRLYFTDQNEFRRDIITTKLQGTLSGINKAQLKLATMWTNNNKVYVSYPNATDTNNSIVCVFDIITSRRISQSLEVPVETWTTITGWTPALMMDFPTSVQPDLYIGDATTGKVYKHMGNDDNGVAISARWDGKVDYFDAPFTYKRYRFGHARAQSVAGSTTSVGIYVSVDGGPFANVSNLSLTASGTKLGPTGPAKMGPTGVWQLGGSTQNQAYYDLASGGNNPKGRSIQLSLRHSDAGKAASITSVSTHYKSKNTR